MQAFTQMVYSGVIPPNPDKKGKWIRWMLFVIPGLNL